MGRLERTARMSNHSHHASIVFESRNARDLAQVKLDELARQINSDLAARGRQDVSAAAVARDAIGGGHCWMDVLYVFLPSADFRKDSVCPQFWSRSNTFRSWFARPHEASRPRVLVVRESERGEVLEVRELKAEDAELVIAVYKADPRTT